MRRIKWFDALELDNNVVGLFPQRSQCAESSYFQVCNRAVFTLLQVLALATCSTCSMKMVLKSFSQWHVRYSDTLSPVRSCWLCRWVLWEKKHSAFLTVTHWTFTGCSTQASVWGEAFELYCWHRSSFTVYYRAECVKLLVSTVNFHLTVSF